MFFDKTSTNDKLKEDKELLSLMVQLHSHIRKNYDTASVNIKIDNVVYDDWETSTTQWNNPL